MRKEEKEVVIRWDSAERIVHILSYSPPVWRRAERQGYAPVKRHFLNQREVARQYKVPLECFRYGFRPVDRPRRPAPPWLSRTKTRQKKARK
jgi:hypothetical protein